MKTFAMIMLCLFVFAFTVGVESCGTPKIPPELCSEFDAATSYLLKVSSERSVPLNEIYYGLLDGTQIAVIFEAVDRENVKKFMIDLAEWYNKNYPLSYTTLINYMTNEQDKVQGITAIISRRAGYFKSDGIIGKYDDCLLRAGWGRAMDELFLR